VKYKTFLNKYYRDGSPIKCPYCGSSCIVVVCESVNENRFCIEFRHNCNECGHFVGHWNQGKFDESVPKSIHAHLKFPTLFERLKKLISP
jgi:transcriptional regulator NrdR family protein